jgi:exonuclease III
MVIKGAIPQKEITITTLYALNVSALNFIKHLLKDLKAHINSSTVVEGDVNTPPSPIDRSSKQKLNREILDLNDTIDQMDLTDVYRIFLPATAQYTFFSAAHGIFFKIDHILGHKASHNKCKKTEITPAF